MLPSLQPGDQLFCAIGGDVTSGSVVLLRPRGVSASFTIKRVVALSGQPWNGRHVPLGHCWVEGDNPSASTDSRQLGPVPIREVRAVAVARLTSVGLAPVGIARDTNA